MPIPTDVDRSLDKPLLGRGLAVAVVLMFLMVATGVFWVWRSARREQAWREQVQSQEPFQAPTRARP